ncbi:hypothetical protein [Wohlfahrtiimonas chitiniclastica]|uniref:hypothetical protein n=1 Tax=Wohlfahrtiimonas chitiniclastica TaxID=400946 RepID=UPI001BD1A687|nr:hypothetical protein [Wohlfahrtiimonas chitiniclastica]MBS7815860.1 hypothetical protein [Wohlfahrtiimonas chitiniclastica]MBS7822145.1 hypothetical protein [Wohlfahrtiimonas chitiniclastica]MBS7829937.1 hypothetical protein [Wohlfahrtiimonas chitiniclastica]MBS7831904.1 hypothetical protein [Wohlfahrtiimonas chitiniclastica]
MSLEPGKILDRIIDAKNIPYLFLLIIAITPFILSIQSIEKYIEIDKIKEAYPVVLPIIKVSSILSIIYLILIIVSKATNQCKHFIKKLIMQRREKKERNNAYQAEEKAIDDAIQQSLEKSIKQQDKEEKIVLKMLKLTNPAKLILIGLYQNDKGDTQYYSAHDKKQQRALDELVENNFIDCGEKNPSRKASYGGDEYWILHEIYDLLSKNNNIYYKYLKKSLPKNKKLDLNEHE